MIMKIVSIFLCLGLIACIHIKNRKFYDDEGRQIRFRGPNVVVKVPPYMPHTDQYSPDWSFCEQDMKDIRAEGFNGVRLGMMWAGVEPTPNGYNETYLDEMQKLINKAGEYGIYTLIDFHQDLIAQKFCGDGVPTWLMTKLNLYKTFPYPLGKKIKLNQTGLPSWSDCNSAQWGRYYFSYDVGQTFNNLYHPGHELNKKFTDFWVKVASRFRNNKNVIAYELINEPFPGNVIRNPFILIPSNGQRFNFQSFYDRLAQAIRKVDPTTPICFEPITFDNSIPTGFSHPPGGNRFENSSIFCYHYYKPPGLSVQTIDYRVKDGQKLNVPSFLTEFSQGSAVEALTKAYQYKQSWLFWGYKSFGKNWGSSGSAFSDENENTVGRILGQMHPTYLQRTAGEMIEEAFNFQTHTYHVLYKATPNGKSILYYHKQINYPNGFRLQLQPKEKLKTTELQLGYIEVEFTGSETQLVQITMESL